MDNIIDLIAIDAKPSEVSDQIKDALYAKAAEKVHMSGKALVEVAKESIAFFAKEILSIKK